MFLTNTIMIIFQQNMPELIRALCSWKNSVIIWGASTWFASCSQSLDVGGGGLQCHWERYYLNVVKSAVKCCKVADCTLKSQNRSQTFDF